MDISETTIYRVLFVPEFPTPISTLYDKRLGQTRDKTLIRDLAYRADLMRWVGNEIAEHDSNLKWIAMSVKPILKVHSVSLQNFGGLW